MLMKNAHDIFLKTEIAADPQNLRRKARDDARWQKDIYMFGRDRGTLEEQNPISSVAFLGYN